MHFHSLKVAQFRNIRRFEGRLSPSVNIFLGENGQGKTNLLEALYVLGKGQSFRPVQTDSFLPRGMEDSLGPYSFVGAEIADRETQRKLEFKQQDSRKSWILDGKKVSRGTVTKTFPMVLFSPESLSSIKDGPEQRRLLLDEALCTHNPQKSPLLLQYKKVLRSRNRVLKELKKTEGPITSHLDVLDSLSEPFIDAAAALSLQRIEVLKALEPYFKQAMLFIQGKDLALESRYLISETSAMQWDRAKIEQSLRKRMTELSSAERQSGISLVGPHKHDVRFLLKGEDSRFFGSQGQQRAIILSFKMAQIMYHYQAYGQYPVLFLDDVLSELDEQKRSHLVSFLSDIQAQIFLTTTDLNFNWGEKHLSVFNVDDGQITPLGKEA